MELNQRDVKEAWNVFSAKCNEAIEQFVPLIKPRKYKKAPYMTSETKLFINKRERLYNICRRTGRIIDHDNYKKIRNQVNAMIRRDKMADSKKKRSLNNVFWNRYVKSKQQVKPKILQLKQDGGGQTTGGKRTVWIV